MTGSDRLEGSEWDANISKKTDTQLYNELIKWFSGEYISGLKASKKNALVDKIMKLDAIAGSDIEVELKKYIAGKEEFTGLDLSRLNIFQLRSQVSKGFLSFKIKKQNFKKQVLSEYDISETQFASKIAPVVWTISESEISRLINWEHERREFLEAIFKTQLEKRATLTAINQLTESETRKRLWKISSPEKEEIVDALARASRNQKIDQTDIQNFINSGFLSPAEAKEVVFTFIPFLTLKQAVETGILTQAEAEKQRENTISEALKSEKISVDSEAEATIKQSLSLEQIEVSTKDLKASDAQIRDISQKIGFRNFEKTLEAERANQVEAFKQQWPATFDLLKQGILTLQKTNLQGFDKLTEWSYIKTTTKNSEWAHDQFIKIHSFDDTTKEFRFQLAGHESVNLTPGSEIESFAYAAFFENLKKTQNTMQVFSWDEMREWVKKWDIESSELQSFSASDFAWEENTEKREQVRSKYVEQTQRELDALTEKLSRADSDPTIRKGLVEKQIKYYENKLEELQTSSLTLEETAEQATFQSFIDKLDDIDAEWKTLWFKVWLSIETKDNNAFIIRGLDTNTETVYLEGIKNTYEPVSYTDFLSAFKEKKAKRVAGLDGVSDFLSRVSWPQNWGETAFENGEIIQKGIDHPWEKSEQKIEFLKGTESDTLVKVLDVNDRYVEIQRGEIKDLPKKNDDQKHTDQQLNIKWADIEKYTLNEFAKFIEWEKLVPDWKLSRKQLSPINPDGLHNDIKKQWVGSHLYSAFVKDKISIWWMMHGMKSVHESITESLTKSSELDAAKFALKIWKLLPSELEQELLIKVEQKESESMDKELEALGKIDSWMAVERVEKWMLDTTTPEYKKEAGTLFMISKYGHLTAKQSNKWKNGLYRFRGKFLFYEALGWRINDELYLDVKEKSTKDNQTFTEEYLVHMLLKQQCAGSHYSGIKRRSRIHKEYENKWKSWVSEEFEKWYNDASNKRTAATMVAEGMWEALWGTTTNAIWWQKKAWERWGSLETMMEIPFSLMYSGAGLDIDQASYLKAKGLWDWEWQPNIANRMMSSVAEMKLFNNTVLELSKEIGKDANYGGSYPKIAEEAQKLFDKVENRYSSGGTSEWERLKEAQNFWKKYGTILSKALNNSMESSTETSKTDTIISRDAKFEEYYEKVSSYVWEWEYFKKDFVDDWAWETWVFGLNTTKLAGKYLEMSQWGAFKYGSASKKVWERMYNDINNTPHKILVAWEDLHSEINKEAQKKYIAKQFESITSGLLSVHGWRPWILPSINSPTSHLWQQFNKWGINIVNDLNDVSAWDVKWWWKRQYFLDAAERLIETGGQEVHNWITPVEFIVENTKKTAARTASNDNNMEDDYDLAA